MEEAHDATPVPIRLPAIHRTSHSRALDLFPVIVLVALLSLALGFVGLLLAGNAGQQEFSSGAGGAAEVGTQRRAGAAQDGGEVICTDGERKKGEQNRRKEEGHNGNGKGITKKKETRAANSERMAWAWAEGQLDVACPDGAGAL